MSADPTIPCVHHGDCSIADCSPQPKLVGATAYLHQPCAFPLRIWETISVWMQEVIVYDSLGIPAKMVHHHKSALFDGMSDTDMKLLITEILVLA